MEPGNNMDMELFTALLANIHTLPQGAYDVDDDDDDDEYDDDDDEDDDDYDYGGAEHSIHAMANPYGGDGAGGGHGDGMGHVALPTMQTMSILQGLLGNASMPDMAATMGGGMGGMGAPMDGGAGGIFPNMPSFLPNMGQDITGALAGAFAGGMNALMDEYHNATGGHDAEDDFDDEDDDLLSDEEDEDEEDVVIHVGGPSMVNSAAVAAAAAAGGMMAGALMGNSGGHHPSADADYLGAPQPLMIGGPPQRQPSPMVDHPATSGHMALPATVTPSPMATSMSGGSVSRMDPLSAMTMGAAGVAAGAGILGPVVSGLLSAVGGKNTSADGGGNLMLPPSTRSGATITELPGEPVLDRASILGRERPMPDRDVPVDPAVADVAKTLEKTKIDPKDPKAPSAPAPEAATPPAEPTSEKEGTAEAPKAADKEPAEPAPEKPTENPEKKSPSEAENVKEPRVPADGSAATPAAPKEDNDDDKTSLGSETSDGKSDTESVRKKTPSPVLVSKLGRLSPTGSESTPVLESASCASITDLASATESMRDSDTDNHSDAHNVTANLSDLDSELPAETQKVRVAPIPAQPQQQQQQPQQFAVGALPIVVERPTFGWQTMVGLDTAKEALTTLFKAAAFPEVFEGTQGMCKGILLFGPSGSGKTCLARALAKEVNDAMLIGISTGFLVSQHPLEASNIVRYLFDHARRYRPAVILFDEVDTLSFSSTSEAALRAKAELQAQVRGHTTINPPYMPGADPSTFNEGLMVVGTTNLPWVLEDDVRRLFAYNVHIKLPGEKAREELFRTYMQNLPHALADEQFKCLVAKTEGYSAADIHTVIRHAAHMPPSENTYIPNSPNALTYEALVAVILQYRCRYDENLSQKYQAYIKAATHRSAEDRQEEGGDKRKDREKTKGVKKIGRLAKSLAAALVAVID